MQICHYAPPNGVGLPILSLHPSGCSRLPSLSLRALRSKAWQSRGTHSEHREAFGEIVSACLRFPRRFAPRNDTGGRRLRVCPCAPPGEAGSQICHCEERSDVAISGRHPRSVPAAVKTVLAPRFVIARRRSRRGNLAVPGRIVGKPSAKAQLPPRDSHVASLLGMTNLGALRGRRSHSITCQPARRSLPARGTPHP